MGSGIPNACLHVWIASTFQARTLLSSEFGALLRENTSPGFSPQLQLPLTTWEAAYAMFMSVLLQLQHL